MPKKQVADNIVDTNKSDIYTKREQLKQINRIRGEDSSIINIQSDGMYNNVLYSGIGKTAFQPATQGVITPNQIPLTTIVAYLQKRYRSRISNHWATIPACSVVPPIYKKSKKTYCHVSF